MVVVAGRGRLGRLRLHLGEQRAQRLGGGGDAVAGRVGQAAGALEQGRVRGDDGGFNGLINEVRIYNRALSASDVQRLYLSGSGSHP